MNNNECMVWICGLFILGFVFTLLVVAYVAGERGLHDLFLTYIPHLSDVAIKTFEGVATVVIGQLNFFLERIESWFLSNNLLYIFCLIMMVEFAVGWWYEREEMKAMTGAIVAEGKVVAGSIKEAVVAVFVILANPWRLLGYTLIITIIRMKPEIFTDIVKAAEKVQKLG